MTGPRRGWRERCEPGVYRAHRVGCPSSGDRRPGRRCGCPWEISVPDAGAGTTRTLTVAGRITDARAERRRLLAAGRPRPVVRAERDTLDEFTASYFRAKAPVLAGATIRNREADYVLRIAPTLGGLPLREVTRRRVEVWLAELIAAASSHRMVVQTVATLRAILATAVEWDHLQVNPAARLRLPRPPVDDGTAVDRVLDQGQLAALLRAAGGLRVETMLRVAGEAGLRKGEMIGLRWSDVDLENRLLHVRRAVWQEARLGTGARREGDQGRQGATGRHQLALRRSARLLAAGGGSRRRRRVRRVRLARLGGGRDERALAQSGARAEPAARAAARRAGAPDLTFHGLRHTAASIMFSHGVPDIDVSRQLGHANLHITGIIYSRTRRDSHLARAAAPFEGLDSASTLGDTLGGD